MNRDDAVRASRPTTPSTNTQGMEVLVLAPRFPAINQPWMDTYLEQLLRADIGFRIATVHSPTHYHEKVDRLNLRKYVFSVSLNRFQILSDVAFLVFSRPKWVFDFIRRTNSFLFETMTFRSRLKRSVKNLCLARRLMRFPDLRMLHSHSLAMSYEFLPLACYFRFPMILTFHGMRPRGVPNLAAVKRQAVFDRALTVLVNTKFACRQAVELGCKEEKIRIIPQGLPIEDFPFVGRNAPGAGERLEILSVGRLQRDKGQAYALLALSRLKKQGVTLYWHMVGTGPDAPRLERLATKLGIESCVEFHGALRSQELLNLYQRCHMFVLASISSTTSDTHIETQGVVLQEAQASGCIPIATRVGGIPECIVDQENGFLVRDRSHRELAMAIHDLMGVPDRWRELQISGRRNVELRFSSEVVGRQMASILRGIVEGV